MADSDNSVLLHPTTCFHQLCLLSKQAQTSLQTLGSIKLSTLHHCQFKSRTDTSQTPADRLQFPVDCRLSVDCKFAVDSRFSVDYRFSVDCTVSVDCNLYVGCRSWQQCGASRARCASFGGLFSAKPGGKRTCSTQKPWCRAAPTTCCSSISHHPRWEQHPHV